MGLGKKEVKMETNACQEKLTPGTIGTPEAIALVKEITGVDVTLPTIISWISNYNLGHKLGGRWRIDRLKLMNYLKREN